MPVGIPISGALGSALLVQLNPEGSMFLCIIAFGSASLIYLITNELLTAVHMNPDCDRWFISVQLFVGFWVTMLLKVPAGSLFFLYVRLAHTYTYSPTRTHSNSEDS